MNSRNKTIAAVIIGVVVITVLALLLFRKSNTVVCELGETEPTIANLNDLPKKASKDFRALAAFAGYLEYHLKDDEGNEKDKKKFLQLQLNSIDEINPENSTDVTKVTLGADCATIQMSISKTGSAGVELQPLADSLFQVQSILVNLTTPNGAYTSCSIDEPMITFHHGFHYKCEKDFKYECKATDKTYVAKLHTLSLEFEINGNEETIRNYNFSTPAEIC